MRTALSCEHVRGSIGCAGSDRLAYNYAPAAREQPRASSVDEVCVKLVEELAELVEFTVGAHTRMRLAQLQQQQWARPMMPTRIVE
jgi:hypothetical protein